ncbi:hypothetical protein BCR33DRAFT_4872 [Rhizoclosmatium globosum]|uniref:Glycosyl transferase CAP10 domain-containing protein n=1 Tax=Rhizoclosmatium globosum TaxID=329046 RepID=A0A1Y2D3D7_9FUNG|nr:hypothetical protein BCR33DRAFT_4872 [Rhizoclosmatium globosum]|eukprot:ORY53626.1 hypothetical protein BCR33DRAFT_4872 [Rhizoclosmatium globosum]
MKPTVSFNEILKYKYLLVVDGNSELPVIFQVGMTLTDWICSLASPITAIPANKFSGLICWNLYRLFNWQLIPWVHYIPVSLDFSNLEERLQWLLENERKLNKLARMRGS